MKSLTDRNDAGKYRYFADSIRNEAGFEQAVSEAELLDVQPWLGNSLLNELIAENDANDVSDANKLLLEGGNYEYCDSTYTFKGLKAAIIYYAFARWRRRDGVTVTAFGSVTKSSDFSEPISETVRMRLSKDDYEIAEAIKMDIVKFLNRNREDYPLWRCKSPKRKIHIKAVGQ